MKVIAVFAAILAVSQAQILYNGYNGFHGLGYSGYPGLTHGLTYAASPVVAPVAHHQIVAPVATKTQYHAQNELGQASWGHSEPTQAHAAVRDAQGGVRGSFSYISPEGQTLTTNYIADHNGYRVASNALPVAPQVSVHGPIDTPEVQAAKAQHFAAVAEAQARSGRKKRALVYSGIPAYSSAVVAPHHLTYAASPVAYSSQVIQSPHGFSSSSVVQSHPGAYTSVVQSHPSAVTYAAAAHPIAYSAGHAVVAAPHATVVAAPAVRHATLTRVVNTPGHAVSYRVD